MNFPEIGGGFLYLLVNFLGATIRWFLGSIFRILLNKQKFSYKDYLNGSKKSFSSNQTVFNNVVVGILCTIMLVYLGT